MAGSTALGSRHYFTNPKGIGGNRVVVSVGQSGVDVNSKLMTMCSPDQFVSAFMNSLQISGGNVHIRYKAIRS